MSKADDTERDLRAQQLASDLFDSEAEKAIFLAALASLGKTSQSKKRPLSKLLSDVRKRAGGLRPDYLYYSTLKWAAENDQSPIQSSKGHNGGYYLDWASIDADTDDASEIASSIDDAISKRPYTKHEERLWAPFARWLLMNKRPTRVSSHVASLTKGGAWGNPDVVGLAPLQRLGFFDVEVSTIEVKPSLHRWEYFFFEAVSHKRFSERSYFGFYDPEPKKSDLEKLFVYAEKYGVGLLWLNVPSEEYEELTDWDSRSADAQALLLDEGMTELFPAAFSPVELVEKCDFLERLGIKSQDQIYSFGSRESG